MKKILIFTLAIILFLPLMVNAATVQTGMFKYMPAFEEETEERYYYSDNYFKESGKAYNEHLLSMSYNLALSTFEIRGAEYSKALLKEIGYKDISISDMVEKPTLDTIGTVIAHKKVNGKSVVAVAVRGEKYDSEWGNNFIVGKEGDAKGFHDASVKVINRIKNYIADNNLDNVKIWMTGYSRAGTITDLIGVYVNEHLNEFNTTADDLYFYTFETPAASQNATIYDNIYVVISKNDLIPKVYPENWGFHTNGKIITIGEDQQLTTYKGLTNQEEYGTENIDIFLNDFIDWLSTRLTREQYADYLEEPVSKLFDLYFSKNEEERTKISNFLKNDVKNELSNHLGMDSLDIFDRNSDMVYKSLEKQIIETIESVQDSENAQVLTDEELQRIKDYIYPIIRVIGPLAVDDSYYYDGIDYDSFYETEVPTYNMSDAEYGYMMGKEVGTNRGYQEACDGEPDIDTVPDWVFKETDSEEYKEAYTRGYKETYHDNYLIGAEQILNPYEKGKHDGEEQGYMNGYDDKENEKGKNSDPDEAYYDPYWIGAPKECEEENEDDCEYELEYSDEDYAYIAEYKRGFLEAYEDAYEKGYADGNPENKKEAEKSMYHLDTIMKNVELIMKQHHPQENLKLVRALDSYYQPYDLTEGADQTVTINDGVEDNLTFKTSGHLEKLIKVLVDNIELTENEYSLKSGSTIVTLKDSYIQTLSPGAHTLRLEYIDNTIETTFYTIGKPTENNTNNKITQPNTKDNINYYLAILLFGIIGLTSTVIVIKKN